MVPWFHYLWLRKAYLYSDSHPIGGGTIYGLPAAGEGLAANAFGLMKAKLSFKNGAARVYV